MKTGEIYYLSRDRSMFSVAKQTTVQCKKNDLFVVIDAVDYYPDNSCTRLISLLHPTHGLIEITYPQSLNDWLGILVLLNEDS